MTSAWFDANPFTNFYTYGDPVRSAYHTGADLNLNTPHWDADKGAPVYAIANGVITFAALIPAPSTWGRLIVIRHQLPGGAAVFSRYAHLETVEVAAGQPVKKGARLGTVGGASFGLPNHLHFDISKSAILETNPTHWPGNNLDQVLAHYVDPRAFLLAHM